MDGRYPLRIRFWYAVYNASKRLHQWVLWTRLVPWHRLITSPPVPPSFRLLETIPATEAERAAGIIEKRIYVSGG